MRRVDFFPQVYISSSPSSFFSLGCCRQPRWREWDRDHIHEIAAAPFMTQSISRPNGDSIKPAKQEHERCFAAARGRSSLLLLDCDSLIRFLGLIAISCARTAHSNPNGRASASPLAGKQRLNIHNSQLKIARVDKLCQ